MHERICKIDIAALADSQGIDQLVHQVQLERFDDRLTYGLRMPDDCSSLLDSAKKVDAQSPTKIPNRSAWAFDSAASPLVKNQMAIRPEWIRTRDRSKASIGFCRTNCSWS